MTHAATFEYNTHKKMDALSRLVRVDGSRAQLASEDELDAMIAKQRLDEIDAHPERVLRGQALEAQMKQWES